MKADILYFNLIVIVVFQIQCPGFWSQNNKCCHCTITYRLHYVTSNDITSILVKDFVIVVTDAVFCSVQTVRVVYY